MNIIKAPERRKFKALLILGAAVIAASYAFFILFDRTPPSHKNHTKSSVMNNSINVSELVQSNEMMMGSNLKSTSLEFVTATERWKAIAWPSGKNLNASIALEIDTRTMTTKPTTMPKNMHGNQSLCLENSDHTKPKSCIVKSTSKDKIKKTLIKNQMNAYASQDTTHLFNSVYWVNSIESSIVDVDKIAARKIDSGSKPMFSSEKNAYFYPATTAGKIEIKQIDTTGFYTASSIPKNSIESISWVLPIGNNKFLMRFSNSDGIFKNGIWDERTQQIRRVLNEYDIHSVKSLSPPCTVAFKEDKVAGPSTIRIANLCNKR